MVGSVGSLVGSVVGCRVVEVSRGGVQRGGVAGEGEEEGSASGDINSFGASSIFPGCMLTQNRWLLLRILTGAKLHLVLWVLSSAVQKNLVQ